MEAPAPENKLPNETVSWLLFPWPATDGYTCTYKLTLKGRQTHRGLIIKSETETDR